VIFRNRDESGMTTAELLGNAALGVLALVVIWGLLQTLGVDIVKSLRDALIRYEAEILAFIVTAAGAGGAEGAGHARAPG